MVVEDKMTKEVECGVKRAYGGMYCGILCNDRISSSRTSKVPKRVTKNKYKIYRVLEKPSSGWKSLRSQASEMI